MLYFNINMFENINPSVISPVAIILLPLRWLIIDRKVVETVAYIIKGSEYPLMYRNGLMSGYLLGYRDVYGK